ncbi:hypothetical protein LTR84_012750 [Exophiala bonariae]|uniref:HNH nuclease domain-containing protein n=1 Tax=Exophiala bonariae TaxID=1690606 RepID=A0AAV9NJA7_9EURO|nr:hypothetical protein LTR84_012750 [Exophiala bonariae]
MPGLPLQLRKDVRDGYEGSDTPVQKSFKKLSEVVGYPVSCEPEWQMLWQELESIYTDKTTFVPTIARVIETWCHALVLRLEDDKHEDWTEAFLEKLEAVRMLKILIHVANEPRPKTTWSLTKPAFMIILPNKSAFHAASSGSGFQTDFENLFDDSKPSVSSTKVEESFSRDDEWSNIESVADSRSVQIRTVEEPDVPDILPSLHTLPRPDLLFTATTPYLMQISYNGANGVTIFGSHEPSLRLLSEYLQRWIKIDPQDVRKIPYLRIKLHESIFGMGLYHDRLTLEPFDHHQRNSVINVALIQSFIEGVLGYQPVSEHGGSGTREFKRTKPFRP